MVNPNFNTDMSSNMAPGLINAEELPVGTHMEFEVTAVESIETEEVPIDMTIGMTVLDREVINGKDCAVIETIMEMGMEVEDESVTMTAETKEWRDKTGAPLKMEGSMTMNFLGMETPMKFSGEVVGEEVYEGHDCWVVDVAFEIETMEISTTIYMDKESYAAVRTIVEEKEWVDSGYNAGATYVAGLEWVLGGRETITTELGTYDCQVIYLQENGETVGTIWVNENIKAPLKYVITAELENIGMIITIEMTMVLVEYTWGG